MDEYRAKLMLDAATDEADLAYIPGIGLKYRGTISRDIRYALEGSVLWNRLRERYPTEEDFLQRIDNNRQNTLAWKARGSKPNE